jgi:septum formation protein
MSNHITKLILASSSPRRKELLTRLGLPFDTLAADIDETKRPNESPSIYCKRMAFEKALVIQMKQTSALVLGSDTSVVLGDTVLGKPADRTTAIATLEQLSGQIHQVITSVCLLSPENVAEIEVISKVQFAKLSRQQIESYCDTDEPYDKAGSYGIQGLGGVFVQHIDGDYSAIMGLPLNATWNLLQSYYSAIQSQATAINDA